MRKDFLAALLLSATTLATAAQAADLRIGLQDDADVLDPDQSRTFVGRIVYTSLCDKLVDITPDLEIIPQLASGWTWSDDGKVLTMDLRDGVTFHDGTPFDAESVKANIERSKNLPESRRKSEVKSIESVEVSGALQVKFTLTAPDATMLAQFADRAGMMVSPTAAEAAGADFGNNPVCSGPFKFVERVQQDRIVLSKFEDYWNKDAINFDTVTFLPIPDTTVRLANLRSGDIDMLERLAATDVASVKGDANLGFAEAVSLGYQGITVNINNGEKGDNPFGNDPKIRQAFSLSLDRDAINQVVFEGAFAPGNQPFPPTSPWYDKDYPVPARDVEKAKALLKEAGYDSLDVEVQVANNPVQTQMMQVVQSMAAEAGFNVKLKSMEFASLLADQSAGNYQASQVGWSGRVDPDGNIHQFMTCKGGINDSKVCIPEVDKLLDEARQSNDTATRKAKYDAARDILINELPIIYLYHPTWIWALSGKLEGFTAFPDGMIRLENVKFK
ncbi:ABC transporter, substrate binding protein (dipeptide) [Stappia aggregata IAM 12614]|uniref:ABC transporter, substrate binding protein (Dipeptide) n=1 Tax=Roseibium aggregatum (strain ATCC 25650 / DSM 13394 / JCM 20685 / NBRC 16684 / NCIMB 2208 / IAM 12614 / B1) TaxID=384765 RepID=A0P1D2_ROSAI|nr:ABC transporter substrate-binding protein [Roseibium aggregatum]EAV41083.1 ABC transporter, substrate binding protein (dipeptide) [Stappia aggregata IAM 12614] [Roseibium aggregatum IAM 12614]